MVIAAKNKSIGTWKKAHFHTIINTNLKEIFISTPAPTPAEVWAKDFFYGKGQILKWVNVLFSRPYRISELFMHIEVSLTNATDGSWIYTYPYISFLCAYVIYTCVFVPIILAFETCWWDIIKIDWPIKYMCRGSAYITNIHI